MRHKATAWLVVKAALICGATTSCAPGACSDLGPGNPLSDGDAELFDTDVTEQDAFDAAPIDSGEDAASSADVPPEETDVSGGEPFTNGGCSELVLPCSQVSIHPCPDRHPSWEPFVEFRDRDGPDDDVYALEFEDGLLVGRKRLNPRVGEPDILFSLSYEGGCLVESQSHKVASGSDTIVESSPPILFWYDLDGVLRYSSQVLEGIEGFYERRTNYIYDNEGQLIEEQWEHERRGTPIVGRSIKHSYADGRRVSTEFILIQASGEPSTIDNDVPSLGLVTYSFDQDGEVMGGEVDYFVGILPAPVPFEYRRRP